MPCFIQKNISRDFKMTKNTQNYDFIIVGGGIVGLTVAHRLISLYPKLKIAILEKESKLGIHASGRNSGVLHSGIYYASDTLKASMCAQGAARMLAFAHEKNIPYKQLGKVIVATTKEEKSLLSKLLDNAKNNKIEATLLDEKEIKKHEPYAHAPFGGIYCPSTAVIDSKAVLNSLENSLIAKGVKFHFNSPVMTINSTQQQLFAGTNSTPYIYGHLFNCAGTQAVKLAQYFDIAQEYALLPFKGLYYKIKPEKDYMIRSNIYPVPDPALPFLGVHLTRLVTGEVYVGPTVIPAFGQENYGLFNNINLVEAANIVTFLSKLLLHNKHNFRQLVSTEVKKYLKPYFVKAARKLLPCLTSDDLIKSNKVGIRPQLVNTKTISLETDFILKNAHASTHVLNAISPAFTCSLAFADVIIDKANLATPL